MKNRIFYSLVAVLFMFQLGIAQTTLEENVEKKNNTQTKDHPKLKGILLGIHGARETMFEIGYFNYKWGKNVGYGEGGDGYSISTEHYINRNYIIAPKIAGFSNFWDINFGAAGVWYFDMEKNNSFRVRPEIGYGTKKYKLTYAFNMAITNKDMNNISKHMVSAVYFLNFNKKQNVNSKN